MIGISPLPTIITPGPPGPDGALEYRWGSDTAVAVVSFRYLDHRINVLSTTEPFSQHLVQQNATLTKLRVALWTAMTTATITVTLRKNGVDTTLVATITAGNVAALSTGSVSIVAGDKLSCRIDQSVTAEAQASLGLRAVAS